MHVMNENKSLSKNAMLNTINQTCSILFQFVTFPYISRILQTDNYGRVAYCNSIMNYFLLLASLGTSSYAIREGAKICNDSGTLKKFSDEIFTINFVSSVLSSILYIILIYFVNDFHENSILLYVLGLQILLNVFNVDWINNVFEDFFFITVRNVIVQFISLILIITLVKTSKDYITYALVLSISACGSSLYNFCRIRKKVGIGFTQNPNVKSHIRSILILFFNNLAVTIYVNSDVTILGILKSEHIVGVYSSSVKIYSVIKKIFQAVVVVTLPRMAFYADKESKKNFCSLLDKEIKIILFIVFPMLTGLIMIAENAILIVSGENYLEGVDALRILCIALIFSALAMVLTTSVLLPIKKEKYILLSTSISSVMNIILNFILIPYMSLNGAALTTVFAEFTVAAIALYHSKEYKIGSSIISIAWKIFIGCGGIVAVCLVISNFKMGLFPDTLFKILFSVIVYLVIEIILKNIPQIRETNIYL